MKRVFSIVLFLSLFFLSCENDNDKDAERSATKAMKELTDSEIGTLVDGEFQFSVNEKSILTTAQEFFKEKHLKFEPIDAKVVEIDKKRYLRIFNKDNYVSTIELVLDDNNQYKTAKTVCTSIACSSGGGCVPSGEYCTSCKTGNNGTLSGDCSRTTTGG